MVREGDGNILREKSREGEMARERGMDIERKIGTQRGRDDRREGQRQRERWGHKEGKMAKERGRDREEEQDTEREMVRGDGDLLREENREGEMARDRGTGT